MTATLKNPLIGLGVLIVIVNAVLLFIVIPELSNRLHPFYNQDLYADGYDQLAANLVHGNGYRFYPDTARTLMREPGYPILLAGLLLIFGSSFAAVKLANMCLALATAWLMTRWGGRMSNSRILLIVPPLLFLFHPAILIAESRGGVEILFTFLIMLFLLALYTAIEHCTWRYYGVTGAVLGLTVLVRSTPMLFPFFLLGYLLVFERKRIPALNICRDLAIMIIAMFAVLSPWIIRNYSLTRRFVPTSSVLGISGQAGEYICAHRSEHKPWFLLDREAALERDKLAVELGYPFKVVTDGYYYQPFYSTGDELSFSGYLVRRVFGEYEKDPLLCAKCMGLNLFNFWFAGKSWMSTGINLLVQLPYLVLALIGAVLCVKNKRFTVIGPMVLFILYVMAVHAPILAQARYSVPLIPLLSILGAFTFAGSAKPGSFAGAAATVDCGDTAGSSTPLARLVGCGTEKQ
jgi:4-amino-4-deoxy-L-arabinose transferase-like glycosyltransferase